MTNIEPMLIAPRGTPIRDALRLAIVVAVLVSAPWYWMLQQERATSERLLADATVRSARIEKLMLTYSTGAKVFVEIGEQK